MSKFMKIAGITAVVALSSISAFAQQAQRGAVQFQQGDANADSSFLPNAIITESFDAIAPAGVACPTGWFCQNNSDNPGVTSWFALTSFQTVPFAAQAGTNAIASNFQVIASGAGNINTWLVSPQVNFNPNASLEFWIRNNAAAPVFPDRVQVRISTAGASTNVGAGSAAVGDFTTLLLDINPSLSVAVAPCAAGIADPAGGIIDGFPAGAWCRITLTNVSGIPTTGTGRIAFRYFVADGGPDGTNSNAFVIDTFSFDEGAPAGTLTVTPTAINYGTVNVGVISASQSITLGNSGGSSLTVNSITAAAAPFSSTGGTCGSTPITIAVGATCTLDYAFTPAASGVFTQGFFITTGGMMRGTPSFTLSGTGAAQPGILGVSATTLAFGPQTVGASAQRTLTISNTGAGTLNVTAISMPTAPFTVAAGGTCAATPFALAAGTSCTVVYRFAPTAASAFTSNVTITTDGGNATVSLTGTGVVAIPLNTLSNLGLGLLLGLFGLTSVLVLRRKG